MSKPDNPPAFPVSWPTPNVPEPGMTLRDYFAGQALPSVIQMFGNHLPDVATKENFAEESYRIADAMLAERARKRGEG